MEKCCVGQIVENSVNTAIILSLPFLLSGRSSPWPTLSYEGWKRVGKGTQRDKGLACRPLLLHGDVRVLNGRKGNYAQKLQKLQPCARDSPRLSAGRKDVPPFGEREPPLPKRLASQDWGQPHHLFTRVLSGIWESMNTEQHPFLAVPEGMAAKVGNR